MNTLAIQQIAEARLEHLMKKYVFNKLVCVTNWFKSYFSVYESRAAQSHLHTKNVKVQELEFIDNDDVSIGETHACAVEERCLQANLIGKVTHDLRNQNGLEKN